MVKQAITQAAITYFQRRPMEWLPHHRFVRSHRYLNHPDLCDIADIALQLRNARLPSAPSPWLQHACPFCQQPSSLHGRHLLPVACAQLPPPLAAARLDLMAAIDPAMTVETFAAPLIRCDPNHTNPAWLRRGLLFGRWLLRAAVRAVDLA